MMGFMRIVIFVLAGIFAVPGVVSAKSKPNVLFIICDDLNNDMGMYGHPMVKTPNLDRLAGEGIRFNNTYCQYPLCGPSRASFMTGLYPDQTGIVRNAIYLRQALPDVVSMSQHFINNGYAAIRIGKIYHYNVPADIGKDGHDDPASWTEKHNFYGRDKKDEDKVFTLVPGKYGGTLSWLSADGTDDEQTDGMGANKAVDILKKYAKNKKPFFLAMGLFRPHTPYVAPHKYFNMYDRKLIRVPSVPSKYYETIPEAARYWLLRKKDQVNLPKETAKKAIQAYYASISFADAQIGKILRTLDETGLRDNTIILFTSDHGYHMGEHGTYQKTTLFENAARVPLIISAPGMSRGKTTDSLVEMVDFYPTLVALAGLKTPKHLVGKSLVPILKDPAHTVRDSALTKLGEGFSIRTARYRITGWGKDGEDGYELYDTKTDPGEMKNLAGQKKYKKTFENLKKVLSQRISESKTKPSGVKQIPIKKKKKNKNKRNKNKKKK